MKLDENGRVVQAELVDKSAQATFPAKTNAARITVNKGDSGTN
jgi:hypothetical protein